MTDIPIIMSGAMVRAILEDRKKMTRRIAYMTRRGFRGAKNPLVAGPWTRVQPGDRLWVRETWGAPYADRPGVPEGRKPQNGDRIVYLANDADAWQWQTGHPGCGDFCWRPSIHMPRWASRLTLIVEAVKREPLQAISLADVIAEGIPATAPVGAFPDLWRSLHGPASWDENPEVVAISFRTIKANIDAEEARAAA